MVRAATTARGMTLVELLAGLLVASLIGSTVIVYLSIDGHAHARYMHVHRDDDAAWLILAAVASDPVEANWPLVGHTLRHGKSRQPFADGVRSLRFRPEEGGLVELRLTLADGRTFSRVSPKP